MKIAPSRPAPVRSPAAPPPPQPEPSDRAEIPPDIQDKWDQMAKNPNNRPPQLLGLDENGNFHLGNVRWGFDETGPDHSQWKPRWKDVTINPADIKEISIGVEPFKPEWLGGHGHAVLEFNHPVFSSDGESDTRIVVSLEAWCPPGTHYTPKSGMGKNFGVVYNVGSFADRVQRQCRKEGRRLILHRLNLTYDQKVQFVKNSLQEAVQERTGEFYHTVTNSCFAAQVMELNRVLPPEHQLHRWTRLLNLPRLSTVIPGTAGLVLERYHLRTPDRPIEFLPDPKLFPDRAKKEMGAIARASQLPYWGSGCRIAGAAVGASLGAALSGWPAGVAGGLIASYVAGLAADHARILHGTDLADPAPFYPQHVKQQPPG